MTHGDTFKIAQKRINKHQINHKKKKQGLVHIYAPFCIEVFVLKKRRHLQSNF